MNEGGKIRVALIFGGQSTEHEVSILSARNVLAALDRSRFEPVLIGIDKFGHWLTQDPQRLLGYPQDPRLVHLDKGAPFQVASLGVTHQLDSSNAVNRVDVVFPVLHGTLGEDGTIQGLLELAGIPYVGAGVLGSAIGMDKDVMKRLLRDAGVPITEFRTLRRHQYEADPALACREMAAIGFPMFTKPANAGSSVGIRKIGRADQLPEAIRHAFEFDTKMLCEAAVDGREIELAVLGGDPPIASSAGEIIVEHRDGFYSYDAKYIDDHGTRQDLPARISPDIQRCAKALALRVFEVLECDGLARVDLFLTKDATLLVNEINTIPGFTAISMYPKLWALSGLSTTEVVSRLIDLALIRDKRRVSMRRSLNAN